MKEKSRSLLIALIIISALAGIFFAIIILRQDFREKEEAEKIFFEKTASHLVILPREVRENFHAFFYSRETQAPWPRGAFRSAYPNQSLKALEEVESLLLCRYEETYSLYRKEFHKTALFLTSQSVPGRYFHSVPEEGLLVSGKANLFQEDTTGPLWITNAPENPVPIRRFTLQGEITRGGPALWSREEAFSYLYRYRRALPETTPPPREKKLQWEITKKSYVFELLNSPEPEETPGAPPGEWHFLLIRLKDPSSLSRVLRALKGLTDLEILSGYTLMQEKGIKR